ncbi:MAG TPA: patatin-like phospholipase family protein, partial [Anaeromyxobacteraceae bacterium]|nr:patatin-like phospholipase family protein [Anaeromyxobacteraceae bacterium]
RLLLDPSTIPAAPLEGQAGWRRIAAHALPYRLSLDLASGGFGLAWLEPELNLRPWLSIAATLEPVGYRPTSGWTSAAGALLVGRAGWLSLGAGPRWWADWEGGAGLGVEVRAAVLQDRLALGVGVRDPGARPGDRGWFVTLSAADLNGLLFWLSPLGASR